MPKDLAAALKGSGQARAQWDAITPKAREAWAQWVESAKKAETRAARVERTVARLEKGDRRPSD